MRWLVAAVVVAAVVIWRPKCLRRHCSSRNHVSRSGCLCRSATLEARRLQHSSSGSLRKRQCTCTRCFDHARADARAGARAGTRAGTRASWQRADRRLLRNNTSRHLTLTSPVRLALARPCTPWPWLTFRRCAVSRQGAGSRARSRGVSWGREEEGKHCTITQTRSKVHAVRSLQHSLNMASGRRPPRTVHKPGTLTSVATPAWRRAPP